MFCVKMHIHVTELTGLPYYNSELTKYGTNKMSPIMHTFCENDTLLCTGIDCRNEHLP